MLCFLKLTATNRNDNFQFVAVGKHLSIELPTRNDLTIALYRNAFFADLHMLDQLSNAYRFIELPGLAVDGDRNHFQGMTEFMLGIILPEHGQFSNKR